jgi:preprotein translocase subunit SecE
MKRVTWPTRAQVQATTLIVILTVFAFALYFKVVDEVIARTVTRLYTELAK